MAHLFLDIDQSLLNKANEIFDDIGVDFNTAIKMFLKRVTKENSMGFLFAQNSAQMAPPPRTVYFKPEKQSETDGNEEGLNYYENLQLNNEPMNKSRAVRLLLARGYEIKENVTFSSRNRGSTRYWANPNFSVLEKNWSLILHDWGERVIYLLEIPKNSISKDMLKGRADKSEMIDLQIMYQDVTFTDNRSGVSFLKYYKGKISY